MLAKKICLFILLNLPLFVESIVGGEPVTNPHEYPWIVHIVSGMGQRCGGSIISKNIIMTAAHCVDKPKSPSSYIEVSMGHSDRSSKNIKKFGVESVLVHPDWKKGISVHSQNGNDIALLKLSRDITFDDAIQPIALPNENITDDIIQDTQGTKLMIAGWGLAMNLTEEANLLEGEGLNSQSQMSSLLNKVY